MIYELRTYTAMPGRLPDLNKRFAEITLGYFAKYGIRVVGFWVNEVGGFNDQLLYMLAYDSLADREAKWAVFSADAERRAAFAETEKNGPLVQRTHNQFLRTTPYSPQPYAFHPRPGRLSPRKGLRWILANERPRGARTWTPFGSRPYPDQQPADRPVWRPATALLGEVAT